MQSMFYTVLIYADLSRNATAVYKSRGDLTLFYLELHLGLFTISKTCVINQCQCPLVAFGLSIQYPYINLYLYLAHTWQFCHTRGNSMNLFL